MPEKETQHTEFKQKFNDEVIESLVAFANTKGRYANDGKTAIHLTDIQKNAKSEVEQKIANGTYIFEQTTCPVCGNTEYLLLAQKDRYGLACSTVICKNCGMLITNPRMTQASLNRFYDEDYRALYVGSKVAQHSFFAEQYRHGKRIADFIENYTSRVSLRDKFVIEVGCGAGGILSAFKEKGCEVLGLDLGGDYLEYGRKNYGLPLQQGSIENYVGKKPDILIYSHVLEHTRLPEEVFNIKNVCHEKTLIYIEVPGLLSVQKNYGDFMLYLQNAHLYHFSLGTLTNLFAKYGFALLHGDENIRSIFTLADVVDGHITNGYAKNMEYLKEAEDKRTQNLIKNCVRNTIATVLKKMGIFHNVQKLLRWHKQK